MRVTQKQIKEAIRLTRDRWERIRDAKSRDEARSQMGETHCGFCDLPTHHCFNGSCPINNTKKACCTEINIYWNSFDILEINAAADHLLKRMDKFDIPQIVKDINKALKEGAND